MDPNLPPEAAGWSPSARSVFHHIANGGPLTNKDLVRRTGMARRTLGRILGRLVETGQVERLPSLRDARRYYYRVGDGQE